MFYFTSEPVRKSRLGTGFLAVFLFLCLTKGGRLPAAVALYQIFSILLFFECQEFSAARSTARLPLVIFLLVAAWATAYSVFSDTTGIIHFTTILAHTLNFYSLAKIQDKAFLEKFQNAIVIVTAFFAAALSACSLFRFPWTFFPNANLLAGFLACGTILLATKLAFDKNCGGKIWFAALAALLLAEFFLCSIGALLALGTGAAFLALFDRKKGAAVAAGFIIMALLTLSLSGAVSKVLAQKVAAAPENTRRVIWQGGARAFLEKPWLGWGLGNFETAYRLHRLPVPSDVGQYEKSTAFAHNEFLQIAVEMGAVGLLAFLWLLFAILRPRGGFNSEENGWSRIGAKAGLVVLVGHAFFDFNLHLPVLGFLFVFFAAAATPVQTLEAPPSDSPLQSLKKLPGRLLLFLWMTAAGLAVISMGFYQAARRYEQKGARLRAIDHYVLSARLNPLDAEPLRALGGLVDPDDQEFFLERAIRLHPADDALRAQLARSYFSQLRLSDSILAYQAAIQRNPKNPFYFAELGNLYLLQKRLNIAVEFYEKAAEIEPFYCFAHYRLGEIYLALGEKSAARRCFENVIKIKEYGLSPGSPYTERLLDFDVETARKRLSSLGPSAHNERL